jgi:hypothetical protein
MATDQYLTFNIKVTDGKRPPRLKGKTELALMEAPKDPTHLPKCYACLARTPLFIKNPNWMMPICTQCLRTHDLFTKFAVEPPKSKLPEADELLPYDQH